jgi:hypothetical protein
LNIIDRGYILPFKHLPISTDLKNNASARENPVFVTQAINDLLLKGIAIECKEKH